MSRRVLKQQEQWFVTRSQSVPVFVRLENPWRHFGRRGPPVLFENTAAGAHADLAREEVISVPSAPRVPEPLATVGGRVVVVSEAEDEAGAEALWQFAHVDRLQVGHGHRRVPRTRFQGRRGYYEAGPGSLAANLEDVFRRANAVVCAVIHGFEIVVVACNKKGNRTALLQRIVKAANYLGIPRR